MDQIQNENIKMNEEEINKNKKEREGEGEEENTGKKAGTGEGTGTEKKTGGYEKQTLSNRELEIMRLCFEQGFLTNRQVWQWSLNRYVLKTEQSGRSVAARSLRYLKAEKLIEVVDVKSVGENQVLRVTPKGAQCLINHGLIQERDQKIAPPEMDYIVHDILVTDIRLKWEQIMLKKSDWYSERILRADPNPKGHLPDAVMAIVFNDPTSTVNIAVEVEVTQKSRSRYEKKLQDFEDGPYDLMFYFTQNDAIGAMVHEVSRGITDLVYVCRSEDFLKSGREAWLASHKERFQIQTRMPCVKR